MAKIKADFQTACELIDRLTEKGCQRLNRRIKARIAELRGDDEDDDSDDEADSDDGKKSDAKKSDANAKSDAKSDVVKPAANRETASSLSASSSSSFTTAPQQPPSTTVLMVSKAPPPPSNPTSSIAKGPFDDPQWRDRILALERGNRLRSKATRKRINYMAPAVIDSGFFRIGDKIECRRYSNVNMIGVVDHFNGIHMYMRFEQDTYRTDDGSLYKPAGAIIGWKAAWQTRDGWRSNFVNHSYRPYTD
jgi:hypothetical protein